MYHREKAVHEIGNILEVGRMVIAYVYWFFSIPTAKLSNMRDRNMIKSP